MYLFVFIVLLCVREVDFRCFIFCCLQVSIFFLAWCFEWLLLILVPFSGIGASYLFFLYRGWHVSGKPADLTKVGHPEKSVRSKKLSRWNLQPIQSNEGNGIKAMDNGFDSTESLANEGKHKRGKTVPTSIFTADKVHFFRLLLGTLIGYFTFIRWQVSSEATSNTCWCAVLSFTLLPT